MILFNERATYLNVFQIHFSPELSTNNIGAITPTILSDNKWGLNFTGLEANVLSDLLDLYEKQQIIGMLQKLNGKITGPSDDDLRPNNILEEWEKIIRR